ncbi:hypothetical protein ANCCAN_13119 [Ancylostoma caninum]|uniref:Uncharacterized protein n=1 Tax=Ancylostoma caninum TaxID=29170 RepID=A0A368GCF0_ANCCA|nr:hypothetical protein ANCCAN_13119 [Ancylostoma caninum]
MQELFAFIKDRNRDPIIEAALHALQTLAAKVPMELSAQIEAETRARTIRPIIGCFPRNIKQMLRTK